MFRNVSAVFARFDSDEPGIELAAAKATFQSWFFSAAGSSIMKESLPNVHFLFSAAIAVFAGFQVPGEARRRLASPL
jgi:hypothetical protein